MGTEESKKIWEENAQFWDNGFREILIEASKDFIDAIALDKSKYQSVLASLEAVEHEAN